MDRCVLDCFGCILSSKCFHFSLNLALSESFGNFLSVRDDFHFASRTREWRTDGAMCVALAAVQTARRYFDNGRDSVDGRDTQTISVVTPARQRTSMLCMCASK